MQRFDERWQTTWVWERGAGHDLARQVRCVRTARKETGCEPKIQGVRANRSWAASAMISLRSQIHRSVAMFEKNPLFTIAEELRDVALFDQNNAGVEKYLDIAEALVQLAERENKIQSFLTQRDEHAPWLLRKILGLKYKKSALLVYYLTQRPEMLHRHDYLLQALDTTRPGLAAYASDVRIALAGLGLRDTFQTVTREGYVLTRTAADQLRTMAFEARIAPGALAFEIDVKRERPVEASDDHAEACAMHAQAVEEQNSSHVRLDLSAAEDATIASLVSPRTKTTKLLLILARNPGRRFSIDELLRRTGSTKGSLKVLILRLRRMFMEEGLADAISSNRQGYSMSPRATRLVASAWLKYSGSHPNWWSSTCQVLDERQPGSS